LRLFLIGAFGAVGTLARYTLQGLVQIGMGSTFPYGTLLSDEMVDGGLITLEKVRVILYRPAKR
jgi:hypothetical protein